MIKLTDGITIFSGWSIALSILYNPATVWNEEVGWSLTYHKSHCLPIWGHDKVHGLKRKAVRVSVITVMCDKNEYKVKEKMEEKIPGKPANPYHWRFCWGCNPWHSLIASSERNLNTPASSIRTSAGLRSWSWMFFLMRDWFLDIDNAFLRPGPFFPYR